MPLSRPATPQHAPALTRQSGPGSPVPPGRATASALEDVFFDFDKAMIREDQKAALATDVAWLKANPEAKVVAEGHGDERGTAEYNLRLGERRAKAVRDFLAAARIEPRRIRTINHGKEGPFLLGHDESAWRVNRRAHFVKE